MMKIRSLRNLDMNVLYVDEDRKNIYSDSLPEAVAAVNPDRKASLGMSSRGFQGSSFE